MIPIPRPRLKQALKSAENELAEPTWLIDEIQNLIKLLDDGQPIEGGPYVITTVGGKRVVDGHGNTIGEAPKGAVVF